MEQKKKVEVTKNSILKRLLRIITCCNKSRKWKSTTFEQPR